MDEKRETKKLAFCCPEHGPLSSFVEYLSVDLDSKKLIDVPAKYCNECRNYYTPFTNLLAFAKLQYRGCEVKACKSVGLKGLPREEVRVPYFADNARYYEEKEKQRREEKAARFRDFVESLREIEHNSIILSNKDCFVKDHKCPVCQEITKKEHVKIKQRWKYVLYNVRTCNHCEYDYISPADFYNICKKADKVIRGHYDSPFVRPVDTNCEYQNEGKYLFIPQWTLDICKYDDVHLPPRGDAFYDMSSEEYAWVIDYHQPIDLEFPVQLREKSFLGEAGYSTNESEIRRHAILERCVNEYGKWKVISQLKSNMNIRLKQKNGEVRYSKAINIWRGDIWFVENKL